MPGFLPGSNASRRNGRFPSVGKHGEDHSRDGRRDARIQPEDNSGRTLHGLARDRCAYICLRPRGSALRCGKDIPAVARHVRSSNVAAVLHRDAPWSTQQVLSRGQSMSQHSQTLRAAWITARYLVPAVLVGGGLGAIFQRVPDFRSPVGEHRLGRSGLVGSEHGSLDRPRPRAACRVGCWSRRRPERGTRRSLLAGLESTLIGPSAERQSADSRGLFPPLRAPPPC